MRKKNKKKLLLLLVTLVLIIAVIVIIINVNKNKNKTKTETPSDTNPVYDLPDTSYSNMEVKYVQMEYLKNMNQTMVSFQINNTTTTTIENENVNVLFINDNGEVLGTMTTLINKLAPGEETAVSVIYKGDITGTTVIKLEKE